MWLKNGIFPTCHLRSLPALVHVPLTWLSNGHLKNEITSKPFTPMPSQSLSQRHQPAPIPSPRARVNFTASRDILGYANLYSLFVPESCFILLSLCRNDNAWWKLTTGLTSSFWICSTAQTEWIILPYFCQVQRHDTSFVFEHRQTVKVDILRSCNCKHWKKHLSVKKRIKFFKPPWLCMALCHFPGKLFCFFEGNGKGANIC